MERANAARLAELGVRIEEARQRFFKAYPNGPGRAQAEEEFASLLLEKDIYFAKMDLLLAPRGQFDSGFREGAATSTEEFVPSPHVCLINGLT